MDTNSLPAQRKPSFAEPQRPPPPATDDPDLNRLIELVERMGGRLTRA